MSKCYTSVREKYGVIVAMVMTQSSVVQYPLGQKFYIGLTRLDKYVHMRDIVLNYASILDYQGIGIKVYCTIKTKDKPNVLYIIKLHFV